MCRCGQPAANYYARATQTRPLHLPRNPTSPPSSPQAPPPASTSQPGISGIEQRTDSKEESCSSSVSPLIKKCVGIKQEILEEPWSTPTTKVCSLFLEFLDCLQNANLFAKLNVCHRDSNVSKYLLDLEHDGDLFHVRDRCFKLFANKRSW